MRDDKNVNVNKLKVEIELLTKQLQEEKEKNKSLEDKIKELKDKFVVIEKEKTTIIEKYETKIVELTKVINQYEGKKTVDKEKFKNIIKNVNSEGNDRNNFYQDEIRRVRDDKNVNVNKLKVEIELLTKQLQEEKDKNKAIEEKARNLEITISKLNDDLALLFDDSAKKENEKKQIASEYESIKRRYDEIEKKDVDNRNQIHSLEITINRATEEANDLRKTIDQLKSLEVKLR